jgi:polyhydroxyalkanoate synthesis regulator phasin
MGANQVNRSAARAAVVATDALRWKTRGPSRAGIWALVLLVGLALATTGWSTPAWAVSADELLDLMVDEGAVTPEKAQKIKEKARKIDQVKKAEEDAKRAQELQQVKEEAKTEAKAEANKEAKATVEKAAKDYGLERISRAFKGLSISVLAYIDYSVGDSPRFMGPKTAAGPGQFGRNVDGHVGLNQWTLQRGYLTIAKEITPWLYGRYTFDITQDATGDWKPRTKYLYAELRPPNLGNVLTQMQSEIGLGHIPWLDFEESIWPYRAQGTMPIERAGMLNSADLGFSLRGNFGGKLANAKEVVGNTHYDGRYGSWHVGVYNGTGYHAVEVNPNKPVEYRVTLRPLPDALPGLQATYFGLYGKGNNTSAASFGGPFFSYSPDWVINMAYLSYQHPWFLLTGQIISAKGNQGGNWTTVPNIPGQPIGFRADSLWTRLYSVYGDVKLPLAFSIPSWQSDHKYPLHAFFRTDWFNADQDQVVSNDAKYTKLITGMAYHIYKDNMLLLVYERTWYGQDYGINGGTGYNGSGSRVANVTTNGGNLGTDQRFQIVFQLAY